MTNKNIISILLCASLIVQPAILLAGNRSFSLDSNSAISIENTDSTFVQQLILNAELPGASALTFSLINDGEKIIALRVNGQNIPDIEPIVEAIATKLKANPELAKELITNQIDQNTQIQDKILKLLEPEINSILGKILDGLPAIPANQIASGEVKQTQETNDTTNNNEILQSRTEKISKFLFDGKLARKTQALAYSTTYGMINLFTTLAIITGTIILTAFPGGLITDGFALNSDAILLHLEHSALLFSIKVLARSIYTRKIAIVKEKLRILEGKASATLSINILNEPQSSTTSCVDQLKRVFKFLAY
ncbi:MAG: hypothetical protein SGI74_01985 [Oligoflexia bacterium]|nr:hypothetical protein [Oligoflexia bacterium]